MLRSHLTAIRSRIGRIPVTLRRKLVYPLVRGWNKRVQTLNAVLHKRLQVIQKRTRRRVRPLLATAHRRATAARVRTRRIRAAVTTRIVRFAPTTPCPHLLESNNPPSDSEATLVRQAIAQCQAQLSKLETSPSARRSNITPGIDTRLVRIAHLKAFITAHQGILHPLRRLPVEVIQRILILSATTPVKRKELNSGRWECLPPTSERIPPTPWVQGHISRLWRAAAISYPKLWSNIQVLITSRIHPERTSMLEESLRRTRGFPIRIDLVATSTHSHKFSVKDHPLLRLLLEHVSEWEELHFRGPASILSSFGETPSSELRALRTLLLKSYHSPSPTVAPISFFASAPRLTEVAVEEASSTGVLGQLNLPWAQLEHLWLCSMFNWDTLTWGLAQPCSQLTHLIVTIEFNPSVEISLIFLPLLTHLTICTTSYSTTQAYVSLITAPTLLNLSITFMHDSDNDPIGLSNLLDVIGPMLTRTSPGDDISPAHVPRTSQLEHFSLRFTYPSSTYTPSIYDPILSRTPLLRHLDVSQMSMLDLVALLKPRQPGTSVSLPYLEHLSLEFGPDWDKNGPSLGRMLNDIIDNRCCDPSDPIDDMSLSTGLKTLTIRLPCSRTFDFSKVMSALEDPAPTGEEEGGLSEGLLPMNSSKGFAKLSLLAGQLHKDFPRCHWTCDACDWVGLQFAKVLSERRTTWLSRVEGVVGQLEVLVASSVNAGDEERDLGKGDPLTARDIALSNIPWILMHLSRGHNWGHQVGQSVYGSQYLVRALRLRNRIRKVMEGLKEISHQDALKPRWSFGKDVNEIMYISDWAKREEGYQYESWW